MKISYLWMITPGHIAQERLKGSLNKELLPVRLGQQNHLTKIPFKTYGISFLEQFIVASMHPKMQKLFIAAIEE